MQSAGGTCPLRQLLVQLSGSEAMLVEKDAHLQKLKDSAAALEYGMHAAC